MSVKNRNYIFLLIFLLGAFVRGVDVWRPVDGTVQKSWRECDVAAVAKSFYTGDMNILYPQIDWRGTGPGYTEMEFPIVSWCIAGLYKIFGFHEEIARLFIFLFSLFSILVFYKLARHMLSQQAALSAALFFALSPLAVDVSNSLQPEGIMFFFYILAAWSFICWMDNRQLKWFVLSSFSTSLAILIKANSAHIGLLFLFLLLLNKKINKKTIGQLVLFAIISLLPGLLWYLHAHGFYVQFHNSLGISNEYHWMGSDFFTNIKFTKGILRSELLFVWMPLAIIWVPFVFWTNIRNANMKIVLSWLTAIFIYYMITGRTSGDDWAKYYHVISIAPASILFAMAFQYVLKQLKSELLKLLYILSLSLAALPFLLKSFSLDISNYSFFPLFSIVIFALVLSGLIAKYHVTFSLSTHIFLARTKTSIIAFSLFSTFILQGYVIAKTIFPKNFETLYYCAQDFKVYLPTDSIILVSGGTQIDDDGFPVAYNASYMFYWTQTKGFNISIQEQSIQKVDEFATKGANYYIAEKAAIRKLAGFEDELLQTYKLVAECDAAYLFEI